MGDLEIRAFKNGLVDYLNKYPMFPLEVKRLVLSEVLHETTDMVDEQIRSTIKSMREENAESKSEKSPE